METRVDRRLDLEPARFDAAGAELADELRLDVTEEVGMVDLAVERPRMEDDRPPLRPAPLEPVDVVCGEHRAQHLVPTRASHLWAKEGVVDRRRLGEAREQCGLRQRERPCAAREVRLCRGLRAEGMAAVEDAVQVGREDLALRQAVGELVRQARLLQLARERALVAADVEVADKLLRDRRAAFDDPAGLDVGDEGACDRDVVDTAVLVEAPVLDRNRSLCEPRRHLPQPERLAVRRRRDRAEQRAVAGVDERVLAERDRAELAQRAAREREHRARDAGGCDRRHDEDRDRGQHEEQLRGAVPAPPPGDTQSRDVRLEIPQGPALHCPVTTCLEQRLVKREGRGYDKSRRRCRNW